MREIVSEILEERAQVTDGISRMVMASLLAHGLLLSALMFSPDWWRAAPKIDENVMVISLGGVEGPETGGMTPPSAKRVDEAVAAPDPRARPVPPPAPKPEMVEAAPTAKPAPKTPVKPPDTAKPKATGRRAATGAEVSKGTAAAETGSKVQTPFGGLSTGGGGVGGATINIQNFCCPAYLQTMSQMIRANWNRNQGVAGKVMVRFVVQRDGRITDIEVVESGGQFLDLTSRRALVATRQFPPLPREYREPQLTVELIFEYQR